MARSTPLICVTCDLCGEEDYFDEELIDKAPIDADWTIDDGKDVCPDCAETADIEPEEIEEEEEPDDIDEPELLE